jgi:hypothetical protein
MRNVLLALIIVLAGATKARSQSEYTGQPEKLDLAKSVQIFPNPATDFVNVKIEQVRAQDLQLSLRNIIGNEISVETEIVDEHELRIRVKDLAAGYYLLAMKDHDSKFRGTYKFLKR